MNKKNEKLSENLEDYLEVISALSEKDAGVRPSDIADELKVKRPSVTSALNSLANKGLVEYEKYKPVVLTKEGKKHASGIQKKHALLKNFFTEILGVNASEADLAACKIEHAINDSIMNKLNNFIGTLNPCTTCNQESANCGKTCVKTISLDHLKLGERALILAIDSAEKDLARFAGLGLVIGSTVKALRAAPLGDPLVLSVRGSEVSLRKAQLASIRAKVL